MTAIFPNLEATSAGSSEVFGCGQECGNESQGRIRGHTTPLQNSEVHPAMVSQYPPIMHGNQSDNASGAALLQQFPQSGGVQNRHDKSVYDQDLHQDSDCSDQEYSDALCEQDWEHMKKGQKVVVTEWENVENKELGEDDFLDIRKAICDVVTGDWKEFGIALGFTPSVINGVSEANPSNPRGSLFDLLHKWVCKDFNYQQFGPPSWRTLVRAVAGGGRNFALAEKIAKMHPVLTDSALLAMDQTESNANSSEADYRLISNAVLGECDFQDIRAAVGRDLDGVWKGFGATLGIAPSAIKGVAVAYPGDPGQCLFDILDRWLRKDYNHHRFGPPSWGTLVTAVASNVGGQNPALAGKIAALIHNESHSFQTVQQSSIPKQLAAAQGFQTVQQPSILRQSIAAQGFQESSIPKQSTAEIGIHYHDIIALQDTTLNAINEDVKYMSQHEIEILFKHHLSMLRLDAIPLFNNPPLQSSNLIDRVFRQHKLFSNIINYHLLNRIVDKCGSPTTRNDMMKFIEEVKCFMKITRLKDSPYLCQDIEKIDGFTALVIRHRLESNALLSDLDVFRQNFCEVLKFSEVSMFFITAKLEEETVWFVPSYLGEQLLSEIKMHNSNLLNDLDITALHFGEYTHFTSRSKELEEQLRTASRLGNVETVRKLLQSGVHVDATDEDGESSLMWACWKGHAEVVRMLLSAGARVNHQREGGSTALHWAAVGGYGGCVRLLLSTPGIDANLVDYDGNTPLKLAMDYEVLTMLQKYTTCCEDFPVHTYGKVIMCGDSGAGKSTLTEAIKDCSQSMSEDGEGDLQPARKKIKTDVTPLTAGIISHCVKGPKANMTIYDLAGHRDYYSSHSSILEHISNTTPSIFLLLVNLLLTLQEITAQLYYWAAMIGNVCKNCSQQSSIIVVGTHADCICDERTLEFLRTQIEQVARNAIKQHIFVRFTALNVTSFRGEVFGSFLSLLYSTIDDVRLRCPAISLTCHVMYAFLNDKVPADQDAISSSQLLNLLSQEDPKVLPTDVSEVSEHLKVLSDKGFIVFFESDTKLHDSWIVFRPEALLEKVNGVLFAPSNFKEHLPIASNTGLIPISVLKRHFPEPKYNIDMITQFLVRFELCQPITFASTSTNAQGALNCTSCPDLFFPPLVSANRPDNVIIPDNAFIWQICSTNINQSFSPRFLHVLVSRIADQFPLPTVGLCLVPELKSYNRRCTVWSRGICWRSKEGFSTVIEMRDNFQCLLCAVSTSNKSNIHYSQLILSVIKVIKNACDEFCPSVSRVELITCPREATSDHVAAPVECEALKEMLLNGMTTMTDWNGNMEVDISQWSKMEPQLSHLIGADHKQDGVTGTLNECEHGNIFQCTKSARDKWRAIGRELGFTSDELDSIVREPGRYGDEDYYEAMLRRWLDWAPPNHTHPSLQSLLSALRAAGKERQANDLATKYTVLGSER